MSTFQKYLSLWVALCIVVGIALGRLLPVMLSLVRIALNDKNHKKESEMFISR